ncbi:MAG: hypothetical protein QOI11_3887 [Candidatus Eremiobacteraeota bacterium]|nr:hypothetical protein [Candidatus Eremiobacteraeota bacterium]
MPNNQPHGVRQLDEEAFFEKSAVSPSKGDAADPGSDCDRVVYCHGYSIAQPTRQFDW